MDSEAAVAALGALAQPSRLAVFRLLVQRGPQGLPAGSIADRLEIPQATLSFHLAQLSQAGLATSRRKGRSIIYAADYRGMSELMRFLTENCCGGETGCAPAGRRPRRKRGGVVSEVQK